jgi:hypothetical protein
MRVCVLPAGVFASRSFHSLFLDTDRFFGSLGSFFQYPLTMGSFEVNPPFDSHSVQACILHIAEVGAPRRLTSPGGFL